MNAWNAKQRKPGLDRNPGEVYIPIPVWIQRKYPGFFPGRKTSFDLFLPNNPIPLSAKICSESNKALMTNPNKALGEWLLRGVLQIPEWTLVTYSYLKKDGY